MNIIMMITLNSIEKSPAALEELQHLLESAPTYFTRVSGGPANRFAAEHMFSTLPPGTGHSDKFILGVRLDRQPTLIGCIDLIRGYPDRKTAMLGLLLLFEGHQGKGLGSKVYAKLEDFISNWSIEVVRLGVVSTNSGAIRFWEKMGFQRTGETSPYENGPVRAETVILEKKVCSKRIRYSMKARLTPVDCGNTWTSRRTEMKDAIPVGNLLRKAYRGTIDDEGETLSQFISEVQETLSGKWGDFIPEASFLIEESGSPVAATLVTLWKGLPLLAYSVTHPAHQARGMASHLIRKTMNALHDLGYSEVFLGVTQGNVSTETLYRKLGFSRIE